MSSKLIKKNSALHLPGDEIVMATITVMQSGKINIQAPNVHPLMLMKILNGLALNVVDQMIVDEQNKQLNESSLVGANGESIKTEESEDINTSQVGSS